MRWEMEAEEIEAALEKIWDLHDKVSDAIHAVSRARAQFLGSIRNPGRYPSTAAAATGKRRRPGGADYGEGFVFVKDSRAAEDDADDAAVAEAKSLQGIRTALENLEDQLEFLHTVQSQQRAERDAAIARLEQSRIILALRLEEHHGKKHKVIDEALAFVGDIHDSDRFVKPENLCIDGNNLKQRQDKQPNVFLRVLMSGLTLTRKAFIFGTIGGVLGNATLFAVSMLAMFQLQQIALKGGGFCIEVQGMQDRNFLVQVDENHTFNHEKRNHSTDLKPLDVLSARG